MTADGGRTFTSQQHCGHTLGGRTGNRSRKLNGVEVIAGCHGQVSGCGSQRFQHRWVSGVRHCGNHPRMRWITWERWLCLSKPAPLNATQAPVWEGARLPRSNQTIPVDPGPIRTGRSCQTPTAGL